MADNLAKKDDRLLNGPWLVACAPHGMGLWLQYSDGVEGRVDLFSLLELPAFRALRRPESFQQVRLGQHGEVSWPCGIRLDKDILYADLIARGCKPKPRCVPAPMSQGEMAAIAGDPGYLSFRRALLSTALGPRLGPKRQSAARRGRRK